MASGDLCNVEEGKERRTRELEGERRGRIHAGCMHPRGKRTRERVRGEKLDLLSEWLSRAHKSLELKLIVRKEISSYKVSSLNACSV